MLRIFHGNGYSFSAEATFDFLVYAGIFFSFACMSEAGNFPVLCISSNDLGVAR
jgi:hypothetical protein